MYPFNILLGPFNTDVYEALNFIGIFIPIAIMVALLGKDSLVNRWQMLLACSLAALAGTVGAKLSHLMLYAEQYRGMPIEDVFLFAGHASIGGIIAIFIVIYVLFKFYKVKFLCAADYMIPFIALSRAIGRVGCLFIGCCHGSPLNLPWAVYAGDNVLRHPTQAYMIIITFSVFIAGRVNYKRMRDKAAGMIFFSSVIMYAAGRFLVEFFRVDSPNVFGALKLSHLAVILIMIYGAAGLRVLYNRQADKAEAIKLISRLFSSFVLTAIFSGILLLMILSSVPKINYSGRIDLNITKDGLTVSRLKDSPDYENVEKIMQALDSYKQHNGNYPTQEQGLYALTNEPVNKPIPVNWQGPYIDGNMLFAYHDKKPYEYTLYRRGDSWFYKINIPFQGKHPINPRRSAKDYSLEIEIHHALALYKADNKRYPTQAQGIEALLQKPSIPPLPDNWNGPYLKGGLKNKKGERFYYNVAGSKGETYSIYIK